MNDALWTNSYISSAQGQDGVRNARYITKADLKKLSKSQNSKQYTPIVTKITFIKL